MLKRRIIAVVVVKDGIAVQSIQFHKYLPIGKPEIVIEFLNSWGIDEIVFLDISATKNQLDPNYELVKKSAKHCFVPLTVGGGIKNIEQVSELMHAGADKVSINQSSLDSMSLISKIASLFGNQCVVASIDAILTENGYEIYNYITKRTIKKSLQSFIKELKENGAGEIFLNSVDCDGTYLGYDLDLIQMVSQEVDMPVICCGGARNANDFLEVFSKTNVSAVAAGNFFHFTEHSVITSKSIVSKLENIRLETFANYTDNPFDSDLRLMKKNDKDLEDMLFLRIEKEKI